MPELNRRKMLKGLTALGLFQGTNIGFIHAVFAGSDKPILQGVNQVEPDAKINGKPIQVGDPVELGDRITTNQQGQAIVVLGEDAFLVRSNSDVTLGERSKDSFVKIARLNQGGMLSVFGKNRGTRTLLTSTTTIGIRGTALYVEVMPDRDYVCTCYGEVRVTPNAAPGSARSIVTHYHDAPLYILKSETESPLLGAPVINHEDSELYLLESLVKRRPPFAGFVDGGNASGGGGY